MSINNTPIRWKSVRKSIVALYSAEAQYIDLSTIEKELSWIRRLGWKIHFKRPYGPGALVPTIPIYSHNTAALSITTQKWSNGRTKHIQVRYHHIQLLPETGVIPVVYIPTSDQVADIFTKPVNRLVMDRVR